jgi:hypothetical protein
LAEPLFKKLPDIWKDLDFKVSDVILNDECQACGYSIEEDYFSTRCPQCGKLIGGSGFLERFLHVPDAGVRKIEDLVAELLRAHNIEKIRERFVPILDAHTGHRWKDTKSYQWNRNRSEVSITRASYKGSRLCIEDLAKEHGSSFCTIVDMSSKVLVESKQGTYGADDSWYFDSDYYHPGVYVVFMSEDINIADFEEDFQYVRPAGTKWIIKLSVADFHTAIDVYGHGDTVALIGATYDYSYKEFYDHIPQVAWDQLPIDTRWDTLSDSHPHIFGQSTYDYAGQLPVEDKVYPLTWPGLNTGVSSRYGNSLYNYIQQKSVQPTLQLDYNFSVTVTGLLEENSLTFSEGEEGLVIGEYIPLVLNSRQPLADPTVFPVSWITLNNAEYNLFGSSFYSFLPQAGPEPTVIATWWDRWESLSEHTPQLYGQEFYTYGLQLPVDVKEYMVVWANLDGIELDLDLDSFYNYIPQWSVEPYIMET